MPLRTSERSVEILGSVSRALDVLEAFSYESPEMALGDIAAKVGMSKSTVYKLLQTLLGRGYIAQDVVSRRYRLGLRNWQLGTMAASFLDLREVVAPYLRQISELTGEQITLWVYEAGWAVCVDRIDSRHRIRSYTRMGTVEKPEDFASGRCLLAYSSEVEQDKVIARTAATSGGCEVGCLTKRLEIIRRRGYETGDLWEEIRAIAAPIFSHGGLAASVSVSGPESRFGEAAVERMLPHLLSQVRKASLELGFVDFERSSTSGGD